jgi:hypothetical protein
VRFDDFAAECQTEAFAVMLAPRKKRVKDVFQPVRLDAASGIANLNSNVLIILFRIKS